MFQMLKQGKKSPLQYWLTNGQKWPTLQAIALKVLSLVTPTAASERNFSTFGFVHSKLRNWLSTERIKKLVFIKTNAVQFSNSLTFENNDWDSTGEFGNQCEEVDFIDE